MFVPLWPFIYSKYIRACHLRNKNLQIIIDRNNNNKVATEIELLLPGHIQLKSVLQLEFADCNFPIHKWVAYSARGQTSPISLSSFLCRAFPTQEN